MDPKNTVWKRVASLVICAVAVLLEGCSTTYTVEVDAIRAPDSDLGHSYVLGSGSGGGEDPNYAQAADLVRTALSGKGMYEAPVGTPADVIVSIDYGVGPRRMLVQHVPEAAFDPSRPGGDHASVPSARANRGTPEPMMPQTESPRVRQRFVVSYVYEKHLSISARQNPAELDPAHPAAEVWQVRATTEDGCDSIAKALPVLAGAAVDHLGGNTKGGERRRISTASEPVAFVQSGT